MKIHLFSVLLCACAVRIAGQSSSQRFQANTFLDMLGKTFDPKVAFADLFTELSQRMNIDLSPNSSLAKHKTSKNGASKICFEAPSSKGATVTYNDEVRAVGTRAFYQCDTGYDGMPKFIYCTSDGQWSSLQDWQGCQPVDCGVILPNVPNSDPSFTGTKFGSVVLYTCHSGYKMDKPKANITCLDTGLWEKPSFVCEKAANAPSLRLPSLQKAFNKNIGVHKIQQLQQLATTLLEGASNNSKNNPRPIPPIASIKNNPIMEAFFKSVQTFQGLQNLQPMASAAAAIPVPAMSSIASNPMAAMSSLASNPMAAMSSLANNPMAAMFAQMFQQFPQPTQPTTTTTTTTAKPAVKSPTGFQLPNHLQSLLPNGLSSTAGIRPQDLMTLASLGLGSANSAAAPKDITQLLGTMNPMSLFGGGMGMAGLGARLGGGGAGAGATAAPLEPEKVVEQREEMMMRAMMASAMKSMVPSPPGMNGTGTAVNRNPALDMMTLMALQSGLNGGGGSASGGGGGGGMMDPLSMMLGGLGGGGGGGGLFGSLFGAAKK